MDDLTYSEFLCSAHYQCSKNTVSCISGFTPRIVNRRMANKHVSGRAEKMKTVIGILVLTCGFIVAAHAGSTVPIAAAPRAVPEVGAVGAIAALTLLGGMIASLRGRRRKR